MGRQFFQLLFFCVAQFFYGVTGSALPYGHSLQSRGERWQDNATDATIVNLLADKGLCTYYLDEVDYDPGLESCGIYCPNTYGDLAVDWNVSCYF